MRERGRRPSKVRHRGRRNRTFGVGMEAVNPTEFTVIEIDFGGGKELPEGVSHEQSRRNEAIVVYNLMDDERHPDGSMLRPDSPDWFVLFPCFGDDPSNPRYSGRLFKYGGRHVCVEMSASGEIDQTHRDLLSAPKEAFDMEKDDDPEISRIALAVETTKAGGGGTLSAPFGEIRFVL